MIARRPKLTNHPKRGAGRSPPQSCSQQPLISRARPALRAVAEAAAAEPGTYRSPESPSRPGRSASPEPAAEAAAVEARGRRRRGVNIKKAPPPPPPLTTDPKTLPPQLVLTAIRPATPPPTPGGTYPPAPPPAHSRKTPPSIAQRNSNPPRLVYRDAVIHVPHSSPIPPPSETLLLLCSRESRRTSEIYIPRPLSSTPRPSQVPKRFPPFPPPSPAGNEALALRLRNGTVARTVEGPL